MQTPSTPPTSRLFTAVQFNDLPGINGAIKDGADLHSEDAAIQKTPLEVALSVGVLRTVVRLMNAGCVIRHESTALQFAVDGGNYEIFKYILDSLPSEACKPPRLAAYTPLAHAAKAGRLDMCRLLVARGAVLVNVDGGRSIISDVLSKNATRSINSIIELVQFLIENGAPVKSSVHTESSPLSAAVTLALNAQRFVDEGLGVKLCELLIKHGADVCEPDSFGTPLHRVAMGGHGFLGRELIFESGLAPFLIKNGADVNAKAGAIGATPLHWTALVGNSLVMKQLLDLGAAYGAVDDSGRTPLHWASDSAVARLLLEAGASPSICDKNGKTTELEAAQNPRKFEIYALLRSIREQDELDISIANPEGSLYRQRI
jgi:ankyrin repeat protein